MSIEDKKVGIDIDSDGKPDLNLDLKTLVLLIGGISSLIFTYTTLQSDIEDAKNYPRHRIYLRWNKELNF